MHVRCEEALDLGVALDAVGQYVDGVGGGR